MNNFWKEKYLKNGTKYALVIDKDTQTQSLKRTNVWKHSSALKSPFNQPYMIFYTFIQQSKNLFKTKNKSMNFN